MWINEIRDNNIGDDPGKLRSSCVSKLPDRDKLNRTDQFAIMTRIPKVYLPIRVENTCGTCRRRNDLSDHIQKQRELRAQYGSNVAIFPSRVKEI